MPAPMALRSAAKGGTVKTPRQLLCFLSPRPRKVVVTEVTKKPVVVRRILRVDSSGTTPRRLRFISSPVLPKKKKRQQQHEDADDDEDTAGEGEDAVSQLVGVDIEEQEQEQEELKAAADEEEEDIFFSAQEEEEEEEEDDDEEEAVPVEVDDDGDILFTKITRSPQHADDGYDEDDSVPSAVLFNNNKKKKQPVEKNMEVDVLPAPRLIWDKVVYNDELHVPGVAIDAAVVHKPAPVKKVVTPSSSSLLKNMTDWNRSAVRAALLQPSLATLHLRIPLRPRHSFYSSTTRDWGASVQI
jgi:hypothetical protein